MKVVEVIPIIRNTGRSVLSYFSIANLTPGDLVKVPIRNKSTLALVVKSEDVKNAKSELRSKDFALKKISKTNVLKTKLPKAFVCASVKTATHYATNTGQVLSALVPKYILEDPSKFFSSKKVKEKADISKEPAVLQMDRSERYGHYRSLVREHFARNASLMFVVPTHEDGERALDLLSKGIKDYVYYFSSSKKRS